MRRLIAEGGNHTVGVATAAHELFVVSSQVASDEAEEELRAAFEHGRIVAPPGGVGDIDLSAISVSVCRVDCATPCGTAALTGLACGVCYQHLTKAIHRVRRLRVTTPSLRKVLKAAEVCSW